MVYSGETFFTIIGCMDGRCQEAVALFGQERFGAQYPDTITEAGLVGLLAKEKIDPYLFEAVKKKIDISLGNHHSKGILVFGHQECAGNPVNDEKHKEDILKAAMIVRSVADPAIPVIPLFVTRNQDNDLLDWEAHALAHHEHHGKHS